jgi:hypothetical protein
VATLTLKPQEIPLDDPRSSNMFEPSQGKPFLATPAAIDTFGTEAIVRCLAVLRAMAVRFRGIDYLQVFEDRSSGSRLWFIEDGDGGAITALLPSDY